METVIKLSKDKKEVVKNYIFNGKEINVKENEGTDVKKKIRSYCESYLNEYPASSSDDIFYNFKDKFDGSSENGYELFFNKEVVDFNDYCDENCYFLYSEILNDYIKKWIYIETKSLKRQAA